MLLEKYRPKTVSGMVANRLPALELRRSISAWKRGCAIVLSGPPGCGKTLAIHLVAAEFGLEVVFGDADDLLAASRQSSILRRGKVLVGDLDAGMSSNDAFRLIEESRWPVVLTTEDIYERSLVQLRKDRRIKVIAFQKAGTSELTAFLRRVCAAEGIPHSERALFELAHRSDGDIRWALIALESLKSVDMQSVENVDRDRIEKLFCMLDAVFQRRDGDVDISELWGWIVENIPERYAGAELAQAYRCMAAASRFQRFGLNRHAQEILRLLPQSGLRTPYKSPRWANGGAVAVEGAHCSLRKAAAYKQLIKCLTAKA